MPTAKEFARIADVINQGGVALPTARENDRYRAMRDGVARDMEAGTLPPSWRRDLVGSRLAPFVAGVGGRPSTYDLAAAKSVMHAHSVATGDWEAIPAHERPRIRKAFVDNWRVGVRLPEVLLPTWEARQPEGPETVAFTHPWRPRGTDVGSTATGTATVEPLRPDQVEVAARLRAGVGGGATWFDVLRCEGRWLRPVFAPGSWEPVTLDGFAAAAREGVAWCDNPFLHESMPGLTSLSVADYADAGAQGGPGDDARRARALRAALDRAGPLFVLGGTVFRTTEAPEIVLARRDGDERRRDRAMPSWDIRPHWRMGDIDSTMSMDTHLADWRAHRWQVLGLALGGYGRLEVAHPIAFPLARDEDARAALCTLLKALDDAVGIDAGTRRSMDAFSEPDHWPVRDVASPAPGDGGRACLREASAILAAHLPTGRGSALRDAVARALDAPDEDVVGELGRERGEGLPLRMDVAMFWDGSPTDLYASVLAARGADMLGAELARGQEDVADEVASFAP